MAAPFARSMRSLEADRGWGARLAWAAALALAAAWIAWFVTADTGVISPGGTRAPLTPAQLLFRSVVRPR